MNIWGWLALMLVWLAIAAGAFLIWAARAVAKQTDEWMEHFLDEWEVGG